MTSWTFCEIFNFKKSVHSRHSVYFWHICYHSGESSGRTWDFSVHLGTWVKFFPVPCLFEPKAQKGIDKGKKSTRFWERCILGWKYTWDQISTENRNWIRAQFTNYCLIHGAVDEFARQAHLWSKPLLWETPQSYYWLICNQITARGACRGVVLSTVIKFDNCFWQTRRNYLKMLSSVSKR